LCYHVCDQCFLLAENVWRYSPAYDSNAVSTGTGLTLNISDDDNSLDLDLALEVADFFRIEKDNAKKITENIKKTVGTWRNIALKYGLSRREQELMSAAFQTN